MDRDNIPLASLTVSDESHRTIEASLAAGTSGLGFVVLQIGMTALAFLLLIGALGMAVLAAVPGMSGDPGAWRVVGFSLLFAAPIALFLVMQIPFLRRLRRSR